MNEPSYLVLNEKCGFFQMDSHDNFAIHTYNDGFDFIAGRHVDGMSYIDIVCPEDREVVAARLTEICNKGENGSSPQDTCACIKHKMLLPNLSATLVMVTVKYGEGGCLHSAISRIYDSFTGTYKSNYLIETLSISTAIVVIAPEGSLKLKYANRDFYRMVGWNRMEFSELFNDTLSDVIYELDVQPLTECLTAIDAEHTETVMEARLVDISGEVHWYELRARFMSVENDCTVLSVVFDDIDQRKRVQRELMLRNERFHIIQKDSEQVIFDYDTETDRIVFSGDIGKLAEYFEIEEFDKDRSEFVVDEFFGLCLGLNFMGVNDYNRCCDAASDAIISGESGSVDFELSLIDGTSYAWHRCMFSTVKDDMGTVVRLVGRIKNIDKQKKAELMLARRMHSDLLTGLLNKDTAIQYISEFLAEEQKNWEDGEKYHALMIIDIDNFHVINDCFGHTYGDSVIKEFASDIKSSFRDTDIVGRIGGDEFIILMKSITLKFAAKKAGRLCRSLVRDYNIHGKTISLSCSIGMAFFGKDTFSFESLYQYADIATYNAKLNGRCSYVMYDSELLELYGGVDLNTLTSIDPPAGSLELSELDTNMIDIAFSLISTSDDVPAALDILLRTVGKKYNLSAVSVLVKQTGQDRTEFVNAWSSSRHEHRGSRQFLSIPPEMTDSMFKGSNLKSISDVNESNLPPVLKSHMKNDGVGACVICRLEGRRGSQYGYMLFIQYDRRRKWSRKETNTFKYIAKIISLALAEQYSSQTLDAEEETYQ